MKLTLTQTRLNQYGISDAENTLANGQSIFSPYYFSSFKETAKSVISDNTLIAYTDMEGEPLRQISKKGRWKKPYKRLRIADGNRYIAPDGTQSAKYLSPSGAKNEIFLTGLYIYFVRPLQGIRDAAILEAEKTLKGNAYRAKLAAIESEYKANLSDLFQKIVLTEGEYKAFAACKAGIPTVGLTGIHGAVKAIKTSEYDKFDRTVDAVFIPSFASFLKEYKPSKLIYLQDSDAFDNAGREKRVGSFFGAVKNFKTAANKYPGINAAFAVIKSNGQKLGLDDLLMSPGVDAAKVQNDLFTGAGDYFKTFQLSDIDGIGTAFNESKRETIVIKGKAGDYVSDLVTWDTVKNSFCIAPTGSGKTTFFASIPGKKIVCCPVLSLVKNIVQQFPGAVEFTGDYKNADQLRESNFIITTYASFQNLTEYLRHFITDIHLIVDEGHSFTTNGHQSEQLKTIIAAAPSFASFTCFTGTDAPSAIPFLQDKKRVIIDIPRPSIAFEILEVENTLKAAAVLQKRETKAGKKVMLLQNQTNTSKRRETLKQYINDSSSWYVDAESKKDPFYKSFVGTGIIPDGINTLVFTTVIETGLSIVTPGDYVYIVLGNFNALTIEQIRARTRAASSCKIYILKSNDREKSESGFCFHSQMKSLQFTCEKLCEGLNNMDGLSISEKKREAIAREAIQSLPISYNSETGQYETDLLGLSNYIFNLQTTAQNRNDLLMTSELEKYQIFPDAGNTEITEQQPTEDEKERAAIGREFLEVNNLKTYMEVVLSLEGIPDAASYCREAIALHGNKITKAEKIAFSWFLRFSEYANQETVLGWLKTIEKETKRKQLYKRLKVRTVTDNAAHMAKNSAFAIFCKAMQTAFTPGEVLTGEQVRDKVVKCLKLDKSFFIAPYLEGRPDKVLDVARLFFEMEHKLVSEAGEKVKRFICGNLTLSFIIVESQTKVTANFAQMPVNEALSSILNENKYVYPATWD